MIIYNYYTNFKELIFFVLFVMGMGYISGRMIEVMIKDIVKNYSKPTGKKHRR